MSDPDVLAALDDEKDDEAETSQETLERLAEYFENQGVNANLGEASNEELCALDLLLLDRVWVEDPDARKGAMVKYLTWDDPSCFMSESLTKKEPSEADVERKFFKLLHSKDPETAGALLAARVHA